MIVFLIAWSAAAFAWWFIALLLLVRARARQAGSSKVERPSISVFKPLPPVHDEQERADLVAAVTSFASQLSPRDQMLIGMIAADEAGWAPFVQRWREAAPQARIDVVVRPAPAQWANPKIAWQEVLAEQALGHLWLWSDADVTAPPGVLEAMARQLASEDVNAITAPYCINEVRCGCAVLDALFVNVEFLPGTLLLGFLKRTDFAYGAATLFRADLFRSRVDWPALGAALADDHKLGEMLKPVLLGQRMVSTFTRPSGWIPAWQHYYRWQKTVRWCRPGGFAALLLLMPAFGWSGAGWFGLDGGRQLTGLGVVMGGEMLVALAAFGVTRCRIPCVAWLGVLAWPIVRPLTWLMVWLPLPVLWTGRKRKWFAPQQP